MNKPAFIVVHTAAHAFRGVAQDTEADEIDAWHKARGFLKIGYQYLIRFNGAVEKGRAETEIGAHCVGLNAQSIGICLSGHGDIAPATPEQWAALQTLCRDIMQRHGIPADRVIGHREVNRLVAAGTLPPHCRTSKSCPGDLIPVQNLRDALAAPATTAPAPAPRGPLLTYWPKHLDQTQAEAARVLQRALNTIAELYGYPERLETQSGIIGPHTAAMFEYVTGAPFPGADNKFPEGEAEARPAK